MGESRSGGEARRAKSWSPRKSKKAVVENNGDASAKDDGSVKEEMQGALSKLLTLRRVAKFDNGASVNPETEKKKEEITKKLVQQASKIPRLSVENKLVGTEKEISKTKAQDMYEDKKEKRQQRRSLRESEDYLGPQGANPRTGYWDVNTATSSSDPSQPSEETKKVDEHAKALDHQCKRFEEALQKQQTELKSVQMLRDRRKKEKAEQKRLELRLRQRKNGKWRLGENGWSSVAEPDLSPIVQSLAGTPMKGQSTRFLATS
jgi:hypothetical protein